MCSKIINLLIIISCLVRAQMELPNNILKELKGELDYETLLVLQNSSDCWAELSEYKSTPLINLGAIQTYELHRHFKRPFLALVCLENGTDLLLNTLYANLQNMRTTATIFLIKQRDQLHTLFKNCFENKMLNVLAVGNWSRKNIYSYCAFPQFKLVQRSVGQIERYFEPQVKDLGGFNITTIADNVYPRTSIYKDIEGNYQLAGYMSLNATLKIYWNNEPDENAMQDLNAVFYLVESGKVDIPAILSNIGFNPDFRNYTDVIELSKWQLMLPVESQIVPTLVVFAAAGFASTSLFLFSIPLFALIIHNVQRLEMGMAPSLNCLRILSDPVMRAMLYQPFPMPKRLSLRLKWIYAMMLIGCFTIYNIYITGLETVLVHPPLNPPIRSYQDMRKAGLKVMLIKAEKNGIIFSIGKRIFDDYPDVFHVVNSSEFQAMRNMPNTSYAYPVTQTLWPHIKSKFIRQKQAAFRLSDDMIFSSQVSFAIPLPDDSIYEQALNRYILNVQSSGLYSIWRTMSFYHLVSIGKTKQLPYKDIASDRHLTWDNLYYIWLIYVAEIFICILAFLAELGTHALGRMRGAGNGRN